MGPRRFEAERFHSDNWRRMYRTASKEIQFPISSINTDERADRITALLWRQSIDDPLDEEETVEMAYRRTITADLLPRPKTRLNKTETTNGFPAYTLWQKAGFPDPVPVEVLHEHDIYVTQVMSHREFFIAGDGTRSYMGITMGVPRNGDVVCILLGGDTPFVLRRKANCEWHFVAEAYVHGIMDGEAMDRAMQAEFEYEDFILA